MTGYRHDELAVMDVSMIAVAWLLRMKLLTVMPVWLYFWSFLFFSVLFNEYENLYTTQVLAVFDFYYRK